ncbi:hypothetical protein BEN30_05665 [Magnetovibrio blakemorei]|uniref:Uncharacterized protein n=1 Tax=Magnetovibrio blakemorei TaxID=28181 RepID=A0A1E5QAG1_9PROT|nr:hypothetical protein BEN30_05665 [Magnetovibrio blakemorei]
MSLGDQMRCHTDQGKGVHIGDDELENVVMAFPTLVLWIAAPPEGDIISIVCPMLWIPLELLRFEVRLQT